MQVLCMAIGYKIERYQVCYISWSLSRFPKWRAVGGASRAGFRFAGHHDCDDVQKSSLSSILCLCSRFCDVRADLHWQEAPIANIRNAIKRDVAAQLFVSLPSMHFRFAGTPSTTRHHRNNGTNYWKTDSWMAPSLTIPAFRFVLLRSPLRHRTNNTGAICLPRFGSNRLLALKQRPQDNFL